MRARASMKACQRIKCTNCCRRRRRRGRSSSCCESFPNRVVAAPSDSVNITPTAARPHAHPAQELTPCVHCANARQTQEHRRQTQEQRNEHARPPARPHACTYNKDGRLRGRRKVAALLGSGRPPPVGVGLVEGLHGVERDVEVLVEVLRRHRDVRRVLACVAWMAARCRRRRRRRRRRWWWWCRCRDRDARNQHRR